MSLPESDPNESITMSGADLAQLVEENRKLREALRGMVGLSLSQGSTIRAMDESGDHSELWANDGNYVPDSRFHAATAALGLKDGEEG